MNKDFVADCLRNYASVLRDGLIDGAGHYLPVDIDEAADEVSALAAAEPSEPVAWMYPDHVKQYIAGNPDGIAWAHHKQSDHYSVPLYLTPTPAPADKGAVEALKRNMRETFDAMCAMRNSINEHIPMPSLESDLLQGPETSVFCATVAEAVIAALALPAAEVKVKPLEWTDHPADGSTVYNGGYRLMLRALSGVGAYFVAERDGAYRVEVGAIAPRAVGIFYDPDAAKAAAQAHHDGCILSALIGGGE